MTENGLALDALVTNPDLEEVARLMTRTWTRPCWNYTAAMLADYERRPGQAASLSLGYRCGGELAGYMAYMPCPIQYAGKRWRMMFASFWTALGKYGLKNIPMQLHCALYHKACVRNYQGLLTIGEEGTKGLRAFELVSQRLQLPYHTLARFGLMMGTPRLARRRLPAGEGKRQVQRYESQWKSQCSALAAEAARKMPLARIYSEAELDYVLGTREGNRSWVWLEDGHVRGVLGGWHQYVLGARVFSAYQVDNILMDNLAAGEQQAFLGAALGDSFWDGIEAIHVPCIGQADTGLLQQAGFIKTNRTFQLNYLPFRNGPVLEPVDTFNLEFF